MPICNFSEEENKKRKKRKIERKKKENKLRRQLQGRVKIFKTLLRRL